MSATHYIGFIPGTGVTGHVDSLGEAARRARHGSTSQYTHPTPTCSPAPTSARPVMGQNQEELRSGTSSRELPAPPIQSASTVASSQSEQWTDVPIHLKAPESLRTRYCEWTSQFDTPLSKTPQYVTDPLEEAPEAIRAAASLPDSASTQSRKSKSEGWGTFAEGIKAENLGNPKGARL